MRVVTHGLEVFVVVIDVACRHLIIVKLNRIHHLQQLALGPIGIPGINLRLNDLNILLLVHLHDARFQILHTCDRMCLNFTSRRVELEPEFLDLDSLDQVGQNESQLEMDHIRAIGLLEEV